MPWAGGCPVCNTGEPTYVPPEFKAMLDDTGPRHQILRLALQSSYPWVKASRYSSTRRSEVCFWGKRKTYAHYETYRY